MDKYFQHAEYLTFNMFTSQSLLKKIGKFCLTTSAVLRVDVPREIFSLVNLLGSATPDPFTLFTQLPCSYLEKSRVTSLWFGPYPRGISSLRIPFLLLVTFLGSALIVSYLLHFI